MEFLKKGASVLIHAYKYNGSIYRSWAKGVVLKHDEHELVVVNDCVIVTEVNGRTWKTQEPAIWMFENKQWSNSICMFKKEGVSFYCNIASPYVVEDSTIKFIDYDLDIKVFNNGHYKILDLKEFNQNRIQWRYPQKITNRVWEEIETLKTKIKNHKGFFDESKIREYWEDYQILSKEK